MHNKLAIAVAGLLIASPLLASAQSMGDLQAQIQALMAQIREMSQAIPATAPSTPPSQTLSDSDDYPIGANSPAACPNLTATTQRGSRDATTAGQVSQLQEFLASQFGVGIDALGGGYFGALTEQYVKRFQTQYGLPAFGIVGSLTRAKIAELCGGVPTPVPPAPTSPIPQPIPPIPPVARASFSASPMSGAAPLTVKFKYTMNQENSCGESAYFLTFGDMKDKRASRLVKPAGTCHAYVQYTEHTYTTAGDYTARLMHPSACNAQLGICSLDDLNGPVVLGSATITVSSPADTNYPGVTLKITPESTNTFVAQVNVGQWTYYTWEIDFGEGDSSQQTPRSRVVTVCNSDWTCSAPGGVSHTYTQAGEYRVDLYAIKVLSTGERRRTLVTSASVRVTDIGVLTLRWNSKKFSPIPASQTLAQKICDALSGLFQCSWNGTPLSWQGNKDQQPNIQIHSPKPGETTVISNHSSFSFTDPNPSSVPGSTPASAGDHKVFYVKYDDASTVGNIYEVPFTRSGRNGSTINGDVDISGLPPGNYYPYIVNVSSGISGGVGAYVFLVNGATAGTPSIRVTDVTGTVISATYENIPTAKMAEIAVVNKSTGVSIAHYDIRQGGSGSVVIRLSPSEVSTGIYYLEVGGGSRPWPTSETFRLTGTAPICRVSATMTGASNAIVEWRSIGATSATTDLYYARSGTYDAVAVSGSQPVTVSDPTVFSFWFEGPGGRATCVSKTITPTTSSVSRLEDSSSTLSSLAAAVAALELFLKSWGAQLAR